ncbi:lectin [Actinoplanes sp. NPDC049596]|uniref:lectin n=1 Tax=unclassified Actinoplanes TaxID=2626549 RepID=UPI003415D9F5
MKLSRRALLGAAVAGTAAVATGVTLDAFAGDTPAGQASGPGDVVGKITVGYQGWFTGKGDGAPLDGWWHYGQIWQNPPSPANQALKSWPDVRDYEKTYATGYANLGDGRPATVFSSYDQQTVDTHFRWMRENGLDTAALQRFNPVGGEGPVRDAITVKVRAAAEKHGRKFYIMYDVTNWKDMQQQIKDDWTAKMKAHTASSAYATQDGRPVVCIWGFGFNDDAHPWDAAVCLEVITWFKAQGVYLIGGTPTHWRRADGKDDSRAGFQDVYHAFDMVSPWMVGRIGDSAGSDWFHDNVTVPDVADCTAHGIDYQPCVLPGDLQEGQRRHGDFMWRQFYNVIRAGAPAVYISMFDEYNEGNQIAKTAETGADVPVGSTFLALDEDGTRCSADYYLRLAGDGGRMLKGQIALTATRPTAPVVAADTVALRSRANNKFVTGSPLTASAATAAEKFTIVDAGSGSVALRSATTGKYVCAENAGGSPLVADRDAIGSWEKFVRVGNADGSISLRCAANGKYVCAEDAGAGSLVANRTAIGLWESFDLV